MVWVTLCEGKAILPSDSVNRSAVVVGHSGRGGECGADPKKRAPKARRGGAAVASPPMAPRHPTWKVLLSGCAAPTESGFARRPTVSREF